MKEELIQFYRQKFHLSITYATTQWQINKWNKEGILVGMPEKAEQDKQVQRIEEPFTRMTDRIREMYPK